MFASGETRKLLINRPFAIKGESFASYAYRLAKANYYETVIVFSSQPQYRRAWIDSNNPGEEVIKDVAALTNSKESDAFHMTIGHFQNWGEDVIKKLIMKDRVNYRPGCIQQEVYHKLIWVIRPINVCLTHGSYLIDRCQP